MTTSTSPLTTRVPLRLNLADEPGRDTLDGGWWPQSRDLAVELADLVDHFPTDRPRIVRALYSPPDWDAKPRQVRVATGWVKTGSFPRDDTHLMLLTTASLGRQVLRLLVVPPELSEGQGDEALLAAASRGNAHAAADLLRTVTEHDDVDPRDHWS